MSLLKKMFKKKEFKKVDIKDVIVKDTPQVARQKKIDAYMEFLKKSAMQRYGYDEVRATKWAWDQVARKTEKLRERGQLVACVVCGKGGANAQSGPLTKTPDGKYKHENCVRGDLQQ